MNATARREMFQKQGMLIPIEVPELHLWFMTHIHNEETYKWQTDTINLIDRMKNIWYNDSLPKRQQIRPSISKTNAFRVFC